jgi:signal transduction histidine kinase
MQPSDIDLTILVVDDTEDNLDLLEFALKRKPVRMLRGTSGRECLVLANQHVPDVILLDIQMPEMDGFETLKQLRATPKTAGIPVIFLTAQKKDPTSIEYGLMLGADEYLTKPIDTEELLVRTKTLVRMKRAEAELERTKADFTAMLVHDLRSPIMGIRSILEFIREPASQGKALEKNHMDLILSAHDAANRMLGLINDMLDLSKFEAGKINLHPEPLSARDMIEFTIRHMSIQFRQKEIDLRVSIDDGLRHAIADPQKLSQVITNLLSNALKFTPMRGAIMIGAHMTTGDAPGFQPMVEISIGNEGQGIHPDELPQLFERYKQVSSAKTVKEKGTGLGLAICKLIIEAHGGSIVAESEPGKLTTFRFTLPTSVSTK